MSQEFDELVRDSMMRFTDGVDVPADLMAGARRHRRRRQRARISWLATGIAVAGGTAIVLATAGAGSPARQQSVATRRHVQVLTTAVVVSRVERALASAAAGDPVAYTSQTVQGIKVFVAIPHGQPAEVRASVTRTWSRGPLEHVEMVTSTGRLALSMETDISSGKSIQTTISYPQRVWWRGTYQPPSNLRPKLACTLGQIDRTPAQWTREVRKLLSCGAAVAGRQRVDGVEAIKLRLSSSYRRACAAANDQRRCQPQSVGWSGVLWASASTYLPVRLVSHGQRFGFRIDFRWLAPTAANLARLRQPIPAAFRHV
jgi:hypothetical protein